MQVLWKLKSMASIPWVESLVLRDEIYFSSPPDLNDPSETRFKFQYDYSVNYEDLEENFRERHPETSEADFVEFVAQLRDGRCFEPRETALKESIFQHFRIFCLTKTATNPVMWAHYADNHGGICIGVDPERVIASCGVAVSGDIAYQDKPFSLKFDAREDTRAMLRRLAPALFIKDSRWSYEQEVRLITFQQPPVQQAPEAVVAVALGLRVTPQTRERVMHWKEVRPHLRILEARQNEKAYDLELVQVA